MLVIYGFFFYLQKYTADQTVVQRYLIARSDRCRHPRHRTRRRPLPPRLDSVHAHRQPALGFYRLTGETIPSVHHQAPTGIFPHFIVTQMPLGLAGLFLAALFGAAMSMLASDLNCLSASSSSKTSTASLARAAPTASACAPARSSSSSAASLAIAVASALSRTRKAVALSLYYTITAVVAGGLAGLFLLAFLMPRATRDGAIAGIVVSLIFTAWATFT